MKTILTTIAFVLIINILSAQTSIKKSDISSTGNISTAGTVKVISTVGEIAVKENSQGTIHISEGFINPDLAQITNVKNYSKLNGMYIYPNPAIDYVNLSLPKTSNYQVSIFDINAKKIADYQIVQSNNYKIELQFLTEGEYLLVIKSEKLKQYKTFKLIKTH